MDISSIIQLDTSFFIRINHARSPLLDVVFPVISNFNFFLPVIVPFILWRFCRGDNRERILWIAGIVAVGMSDLLCARVIKEIVGRVRPYEVLDGIYLFKGSKWLVTDPAFRSHISGTLAWPSCHATNMWTAASYLTAWWRWGGVPVIVLAILVCWSRIYLGVHYPLDVVGGTVTGIILGLSTWKAVISFISFDKCRLVEKGE